MRHVNNEIIDTNGTNETNNDAANSKNGETFQAAETGVLSPPTFGWCVLYVGNVEESTRFYAGALGLSIRFVHESGGYTELETGGTALALCDRAGAAQSCAMTFEHPNNQAPTSNITLVCSDVAAHWAHALHFGAEPISAPAAKPWGQVCAYLRDPDGHLIELATAIER
jgi:lactoylglutathione lyase